jgi:hypothetical protein
MDVGFLFEGESSSSSSSRDQGATDKRCTLVTKESKSRITCGAMRRHTVDHRTS